MEERHDETTNEGDDGHCEEQTVIALHLDAKDRDVVGGGGCVRLRLVVHTELSRSIRHNPYKGLQTVLRADAL